MNMVTAIRMAKPWYSPARGVRIYDSKWYRVVLQDVETDPLTDYHGLAETETTYIMRGRDARACRDRALNHCNAISEYTGPVWNVSWREYGLTKRQEFTDTEEKARALARSIMLKKAQYISACREEAEKYRRLAATADGKEKELHLESASDCTFAALNAAAADWSIVVQQIA